MAVRSPVKIQNFFELSGLKLDGEMLNFNKLKGRVVLVENVASLWGTTTRDFSQMNELVSMFGDKLVILAFPSNQFGHQENAKGEEILRSLKYVRPGDGYEPLCVMMEKVDVNGKNAHPVFQYLRERLPYPSDDGVSLMKDPKCIIWDPVTRTDIAWNFEKFLIAPDGKPFQRYSRSYQTINIQNDIDGLIQKFNVEPLS